MTTTPNLSSTASVGPRTSPWARSAVVALLAAAPIVGGCSGGDDDGSTAVVPDDTSAPSPSAPDVTGGASQDEVVAPTEPTVELVLDIDVELDVTVADGSLPSSAAFAVAIDPASASGLDPFGRFASCSGWRDAIGTYSVVASDPEAEVRSIGIITSDRVTAAGVVDADVTIETAAGVVDAVGTVTIDDGLRSGRFTAFGSDGGSVAGTFDCRGRDAAPMPIADGPDDGVLDTIEVVALLRQGEAERVLGLAFDRAVSDGAAAEEATCPAVESGDGPIVVGVSGDQRLGGITGFELTNGSQPAVRLEVDGTRYELSAVDVELDPGGAAGRFGATGPDGISVDGAFRCT